MESNVIQCGFSLLVVFFWGLLPRRKGKKKKVRARLSVSNFSPPLSLSLPLQRDLNPKPPLSLTLTPSSLSLSLSLGFLLLFFSVSISFLCLSLFLCLFNNPPHPTHHHYHHHHRPAPYLPQGDPSVKYVVTSPCPQCWKMSPGHLFNLYQAFPGLYPLPPTITLCSSSSCSLQLSLFDSWLTGG